MASADRWIGSRSPTCPPERPSPEADRGGDAVSVGMRALAPCGSATARSTNARTTCSARSSTRSSSTPGAASASHAGCGRSFSRRPIARSAVWREPDQGIWEARGEPQHYVSSKLMGWVALDRAAKLAEIRGARDLRESWQATADEIRADILAHGVSDRGVLRQHYDTDSLDASTLLAPVFGFLHGGDEVARNTTLAIANELTENGYVLRYRRASPERRSTCGTSWPRGRVRRPQRPVSDGRGVRCSAAT